MKFEFEGFREERGHVWPEYDKECARAVFNTLGDMQRAVSLCKKMDVVIQAGGNCGVWANELAKQFRDVYTFEPDQKNFVALAANTYDKPNIVKMQAALGDIPQLVNVVYDEPANCGCGRVNFTGAVPTLRLDDLGLRDCDLICIDVEGRELAVLQGATNLIRKHKPVILLEDKGLSSKYGVQKGAVEKWLIDHHNYRVEARVSRDIILVEDHVIADFANRSAEAHIRRTQGVVQKL